MSRIVRSLTLTLVLETVKIQTAIRAASVLQRSRTVTPFPFPEKSE